MIKTLKNRLKLILRTNKPPYLLQSQNNITVGEMSFHNGNFSIEGSQKVSIGSYCAFGKNLTILTDNHDYNFPVMQYTFHNFYFNKTHPGNITSHPNKEKTKGPVMIGNDVWIGHNVTILSGVKIGNGAILANGCIVTKDIEPYSIAGGIPARVIKKRFNEEIIQFLQEIEWWNWDKNKIELNERFFYQNLNSITLEEIKSLIK